jgi:RNA polymerase sigma-70 factor, ECF subfamily
MAKNSLSDEMLVEIVRNGDFNRYGEIVNRYQEALLRYARYLLSNSLEAEDIVQESFIKAYKNLFRFNTKKKFSSWIYRIVHNEAINFIKKNKKQVSLEEHNFADFLKNDEDVELDFEKKEMQKYVKDCMKKIPLNYSEPLTLHFIEELSYEEISDILRMPMGTVGTRINRAKKMLKKICQKKGGGQNGQ